MGQETREASVLNETRSGQLRLFFHDFTEKVIDNAFVNTYTNQACMRVRSLFVQKISPAGAVTIFYYKKEVKQNANI